MSKSRKSEGLEKAMEQLEAIVTDLEEGEFPLEEALDKFEQGLKLGKQCRKILDEAELRVKKLVENSDGDLAVEDFEGES